MSGRHFATMKTWLIVLYLATSGISSFSQVVADGQGTEAGSPLLSEDLVEKEKPELHLTTNANTKDKEGIWDSFKRTIKPLWTFLGISQDTENDQPGETGAPLPSQDAGGTEEHELNPNIDIINKNTWKPFWDKQHFSTKNQDNCDENKKLINEHIESNPEKEETSNVNFNSHELQGEATTSAYKQTSDLDGFFQVPKSQNGTETPVRTTTVAETTLCPPQKCPPPRRNPWAACTNPTPEDDSKLAEALTEFAVHFYKAATRQMRRDSNFIFSPISITTMLSNLLLGTCGESKDRLEKLLFYPKDFTCVHKALKALSKSEALTSANAIFHQSALKLESDFRNLSKVYYQTELVPLTNNSDQAVVDINAWVSKHTDGKIKKLLDSLDPDVQMVLLNAVYFHAKWKTMFKLKNTREDFFHRPGLPRIKVPMMMSKKYPVASYMDRYLEAKVGRFQLSHGMSLVIIVPRSLSQNLSEVEEQLSASVFKSMMTKLEAMPFKPTVVSLPKFKLDSSQDLMEIVGEMDYGFFFDTNLCGISRDEELAVSGAQHRAVIQISEEGVEAAAATEVSLARSANFFEVQQPFMFMLWKDKTAPLFLGRINDPQTQ